jgi:hypothetical protein
MRGNPVEKDVGVKSAFTTRFWSVGAVFTLFFGLLVIASNFQSSLRD